MKAPCIHRYVIESPHDGKSQLDAKCRLCGAKRKYDAGFQEAGSTKLRHFKSLARHVPDFVHGRYGPN